MRTPTRFTSVTPLASADVRTSAHTMAYCSPAVASVGTAIVTVAAAVPPAGIWGAAGLTDVHDDRSLAACAASPMNDVPSIVAAAAYSAIERFDEVVLDTSTWRWITAPG